MTPAELTDRERTAACLVASGLTTKQIAAAMQISEQRVRILVSAVAYKIGADASRDERVQVALWWAEHLRPAA